MPAATKKRPPLEMEPGEGKAHEMGETPTEETREGAEPDDAPKSTSRKRSAKNAKNTKAPMDSDCGCGGKKGASCDGDCGKKMGRNDALTPQEYLAACDLGIQGRSRAYIRSRLDSTARLDKKCGASGIPDNAKCTKGSGSKNNMLGTLAAATLIGGSIAAANEIERRKQQELKAKDVIQKVNSVRFKANAGVTAAARAARNGVDFARTAGYLREKPGQREQAVNQAISEGMGRISEAKKTRAAAYSEMRQSLNELGQMVPKSPARRRRAKQQRERQQPGGLVRLNSLYADGFTPDLAQLAL